MAQDFFGHEVGISQVVKHLRLNEHADLAKAVTAQHKCRNLAAHPTGDLDVRVRLAFEKTFVKKDPLMDNDPWKQKVAGQKSRPCCERDFQQRCCCRAERNCCCSGKVATSVQLAPGRKQETSQLKLMPTPNLPSLMFRRSATRWIF